MYRYNLLFIVSLLPFLFYGQFINDFSGSLESQIVYYTDDDKITNPEEAELRSNNYIRFNYSRKHFEASIQFESYYQDAILGYSPELDQHLGLSTFSLGYTRKSLGLSAGYIFDQFGSGLIYRAWEDRQLGINNALIGGKVKYSFKQKVSLAAFLGKQKNGFDISLGTLLGLNSVIKLNQNFNLDLGFVSRYEDFDSTNPNFSNYTNLYQAGLKFTYTNFYSSLEYIYKSDDALVEFHQVIDSRLFSGNSLSLNLGYFKSGFGLDATFRRLENMSMYTDRTAYGNIYNELIVNYIPALTKQHNFGLSNIYVYQAQPQLSFISGGKAGEIGQQVDVYYQFLKPNTLAEKYKTMLAFNYSSWFGLKADYDIEDRTYSSAFLQYGDKYYSDVNIALDNEWSEKLKTKLFWMNQFYNSEQLGASTGTVNTNIVAIETYYTIRTFNELHIQIEHLWTPDDKKNWIGALLEYQFLKKYTIYLNDLYNYGNVNEVERIHYYNIGGSYRYRKTKFSLNYGRQRGGLICLGGVCRFVPKSNGVTFAMNLYL